MSNHLNQPLLPSIPGYILTEELYVGGGTAVYRALVDTDDQASPVARSVVIKVLRSPHPSFKALVRFRNQYIIAKNLSMAGIVSPLTLKPWAHGYALVMEDVGGIALREYLQNCGPLSVGEVLEIALKMADILHHLSQNRVLHKDINPANILIHPDTQAIWLTDFSLASLLPKESQKLQNPCALEGTLAYIAPEQTGRMNRGIDYRADFYGLGVTLYELLTGELPFQSDDPMALLHCHIAKVPVTPYELLREQEPHQSIPKVISDIVLKLMAKNAEDRYQSALGFNHDLQQCLSQWEACGQIDSFDLGQADRCDRFLIPEKLYGRDAEVQTLLDAFERVSQGSSELMLVAGFSGIGKTVVVNEVHKPITERKGYFIKGKFDQFNRNIPFSAFVQAFRSLMGQLLGESDTDLGDWRAKILAAVGESAQVLIEVIPELEHILGKQPAVPELSGSAAQNRFNLLFGKFIRVFTTLDHPLVIFLDDLQWIDSASLKLFKLLMDDEAGYLLVLGAYRDNEVFPAHPLMLTLDEMSQQSVTLNTLTLTSLKEEDLNHLVADSLHCARPIALPFSQLVYQKTQGNPFFATQFLQGLQADGWITFNADAGHWQCDLTQVRQLALTDDVVVFMVGRIQKLSEATQNVLKIAACMGNRFDLTTLAVVCQQPTEEVAVNLWQALQIGLVIPESETYKFFQGEQDEKETGLDLVINYRFLHDRVQQAAYSLIPDNQKRQRHLLIGQLLLKNLPKEEIENRFFDIVNHLNMGAGSIVDNEGEKQLCELNLKAGYKSKSATAYAAAKDYFLAGIDLLENNSWEHQYELTLALYQAAAESAYLSGDFLQMEQLAAVGLTQARTLLDTIPIHEVKLQSLQAQTRFQEAIDVAIAVLQQLGTCSFPEQPNSIDTECWLEEIKQILGERQPLDLLELPSMTDAKMLAAMGILANIAGAAYITQPNLFILMVFERVRLSINYGNNLYSDFTYAGMGLVLCGAFNKIDLGYQFGELAIQLALKQPTPYSGRAIKVANAQVKHHQEHLRNTLPGLKNAYAMSIDNGDFEYVGYAALYYASHCYLSGQDLTDLARELSGYSQVLERLKQESSRNYIDIYRQTIENLLSRSNHPSVLVGNIYDENKMLPLHQQANDLTALFYIYLHRGILCYWFGDWEKACESFDAAEAYLEGAVSTSLIPLFHFYRALAILAKMLFQPESEHPLLLETIATHQEKIQYCAVHASMNYLHKWHLVEAEKFRISGKKLEAIEHYESAIAGAKENQFIQEEALANELFAKFYLAWDKQNYAALHMQAAYYGYVRWGATAKTNDLEQRYPNLLRPIFQEFKSLNPIETLGRVATPNISSHSSRSSGMSVNARLDFVAVLKAAQMLSEKMHIDDLLTQIVQLRLQNSGADKLVIVLPDDGNSWEVRAVATPETTRLSTEPLIENPNLPIQLIRYVKNTQQIIAIDNLDTDLPILDTYLQQHRPCSVLCLPILHQGNLNGLLYLQNKSVAGVFTLDRITVLNFLGTQAAIALANAQLYQESQTAAQQLEASLEHLQRSETRFRNLAANVPGVIFQVTTTSDGTSSILYISPDCDALFEVSAEVMKARHPSLRDFEYPEDRPAIDQLLANIKQTLEPFDHEFRIVTPSGKVKWVHAVARLYKQSDGAIRCDGVVMDISDRKAIERQLGFTQYGLDHAADCFYCLDEEAHIVQVNQATCQRTGYTKDQLLNMTVHELTPTCPKETTWKPHWDKLKRLKSYSFESVQQTRTGEIFPVEVVCNYLEFEGKAYDFELVRDITARRQAETALHLSEARATATFKQAPVGFAEVALSTNNQLSRVNPCFCQMLGYTNAELVGMTVQEITHPDDIALGQEPSKRLFRGELSSFTIEKRYLRKDGTDFWAETTVYLIRQQNGEALCEVAFIQDISEKKRLELQHQQAVEALQLSEVRANATFDQAVVGMAESNLIDGKIIRPNSYCCQMLGYTEQELESLTVAEVTHPDDVSDSLTQIKRLLSGEIDSFIVEKRYIRKDKSWFWAITTVSLIQSSEEEAPRCLGIMQDISDRKAAEQKLLESQSFLQTILDTFPLSVFWKDRDSRYIGVNQNFAKDAGFKNSEDIAGLTDSDMPWAASEGHLYQADDQEVMVSDAPKLGILETQIQADGTQVWIETNKLPLHDLDGNVIGVMGTYQDISDRRQAEMALEKEALRRTAVFNASPDGIHVLDKLGNVLEANEGFAQMLGYSLDEAFRLNVADWDAQWSAEELQDILQEIFQNYFAGPQETFETLHRRKDGSVFPVEISACPMEWNGEFSIICISRDISERKRAESELKRTNQELARATRMKDQFLANMSHELRTPLNAILGMTEGFQDEVFGSVNEQQKKVLTTIEQSGLHLLELINEILDLAKIEAGNIDLTYATVSVTHLCQSSLALVKQQSLEKGVQLHLKTPWDLPPIRVDERRIRQVLINLLNNAVKFTPSGGSVTLSVAPSQMDAPHGQHTLRFSVTDTGIGIDPDEVSSLFQPFVQIDSALNRQYEGTGLGLALVKRIVELHGGDITVTSEVDVGSSFTIELPYDKATLDAHDSDPTLVSSSAELPEIEPPIAAPLILIAEDNEANIVTLSSYLHAKGYRILVATNGQDALDLAQAELPHIILMDIQMPEMDGLTAIEQIRQRPNIKHTPIIALTAFAMEGDETRCLAAGANKYLSKPVKLKQLALSIQALIT